MKPNFALTLSFDGIGLLRRAPDGAPEGWERVGEVPLDVPDLSEALGVLKRSADDLGSGAIQSKLILPDEQIKYLTIVDPQGGEDVQAEAVRHALDGATPYTLDELAYDWTVDGQMLHIAAVARETLAEAEGFAADHGFEPLYFAAMPEQGRFSKEPFFGPTQHFSEIGGSLAALEPDTTPIKIVGIARPPEVAPEPEPTPAPEPVGEQRREPEDSLDIELNFVDEPPVFTRSEPSAPEDMAPVSSKTDDTETGEAEAGKTAAGKTAAGEAAVKGPEAAPTETFTTGPARVEPVEEPARPDVVETPPAPRAPAPETPAAAFASRRNSDDAESTAPKLAGVTRAEPDVVASSIPIDTSDLSEASAPPPAPLPAPDGAASSFFSRRGRAPAPQKEPREGDSKPAKAATSFSLQNLRRSPEPSHAQMPPPNVVPPAASEKQRLTVFGARKDEKPAKVRAIGGKPRFLGLILTAALLVFLVGVAAWASIFVDDGLSRFFKRSDTDFAAMPNAPDETLVEGEEAGLPDGTIELASLDPDTDTRVQAQLQPKPIDPISEEEARVKYAVTGIWVMPPAAPDMPLPVGEDDLYVASIDRDVGSNDAIALPALDFDLSDRGMSQQANPSERGQKFALDARGLVIATREGALSPDGHLVFLGKPPYVPRSLPDREKLAAAANAVPDASMARLAAFRPKLRPAALAENNQRATLGGRSLVELAALRPKLRPPSVRDIARQQAEAAKVAAAAAEAAKAAAAETPEVIPQTPGAVAIKLPDPTVTPGRDLDPNATPQAVARSVKPKYRPRDFSRIVKRAEAKKERVTNVAAVAPKTVTPRIPSTASVAKQATVRNAINLKRVNLIGVYGKPSSRRALVRMANGRYKKVKVGDRIDGGQISAIGEAELRYRKNGRNVTLKMPRS